MSKSDTTADELRARIARTLDEARAAAEVDRALYDRIRANWGWPIRSAETHG